MGDLLATGVRKGKGAKVLMSQSGSVAWLLVLLIALGGSLGVGYIYRDLLGETKLGQFLHLKTAATSKDTYYCPMHPQYQSERPGTCPICNMNLEKAVPAKEATSRPQTSAATDKKDVYDCPMHPQIHSDKPGTCPICNMNLVKRAPDQEPPSRPEAPVAKEGQAPADRKVLYWTDPMIPGFKADKPGKSPMGMDLVPVYEEETPPARALPPGTVRIAPQTQQLIGVEYGEVSEQPLAKSILTVGRLTYDETKIARIQPRIEGWIDRVFVDSTGKLVKKGQPLFSLYSPELFSAQQELLIARKTMETLANSEFKEVSANAESLYQSTKERLKLWNITDGEIKQIEKKGTPTRALTLYSPIDGFVLTRNAYPGQRIAPDTELYAIADLSTIWVLADVFEYEIAHIQLGQTATMELSYFPGETFKGVISFIYPALDSTSRTLKVRLQFPQSGIQTETGHVGQRHAED